MYCDNFLPYNAQRLEVKSRDIATEEKFKCYHIFFQVASLCFFYLGFYLSLSLQLLWLVKHSVSMCTERVTIFFPSKVCMIILQKVLVLAKVTLCMFTAMRILETLGIQTSSLFVKM